MRFRWNIFSKPCPPTGPFAGTATLPKRSVAGTRNSSRTGRHINPTVPLLGRELSTERFPAHHETRVVLSGAGMGGKGQRASHAPAAAMKLPVFRDYLRASFFAIIAESSHFRRTIR